MLKKVLLLFTVILFTGCVERGYDLTVNNQTNTVTAIKSVDIRTKETTTTRADIEKMNTAVHKEQKKQPQTKQAIADKPSKKQNEKLEKELADKKKREETLEEEKAREAKNKLEAEQLKATQERKALEEKLAAGKEAKRLAAEKERALLKEKTFAEKEEARRKAEALQKIKATKEKEIMERKLAKEEQMRAQKEEEARKQALANKKPLATTETLTFKPSSQTYQKFGTSEIHGHVVYLTPAGQEINLQNTKIYLVPKNTKTDYWYNNYYLKNKEASSLSKTVVHYMNATHLNVEKNFAFYGLATGVYYVIIESNYPPSVAKNKKVYIAKKINVEKYKKIMTVFSKKL